MATAPLLNPGGQVILTSSSKASGYQLSSVHGPRLPPAFHTADILTSIIVATNTTRAIYIGRASEKITSMTYILSVTVAAAGITWAEVGVATGSIVPVGSPTLNTVGYTNVASVVNSTGIKTGTITITGSIVPGDEIWFLVGNQATTALQLRAGSIVDDLWTGMLATATARVSTLNDQLFTGGNQNCAWVYLW